MKRLSMLFFVAMALWWLAFAAGFWSISTLPQGDPPTKVASGNLLVNNLLVLALTLSGLLTAGLTSVLEMIVNGFFVGAMTKSFALAGLSARQIITFSWVHGILELTGFWLAAGVGLEGFGIAWNMALGRDVSVPTRRLALGAGTAIALIVTAAFVEVKVSLPAAIKHYSNIDRGGICEQSEETERHNHGNSLGTSLDCRSTAAYPVAQ